MHPIIQLQPVEKLCDRCLRQKQWPQWKTSRYSGSVTLRTSALRFPTKSTQALHLHVQRYQALGSYWDALPTLWLIGSCASRLPGKCYSCHMTMTKLRQRNFTKNSNLKFQRGSVCNAIMDRSDRSIRSFFRSLALPPKNSGRIECIDRIDRSGSDRMISY